MKYILTILLILTAGCANITKESHSDNRVKRVNSEDARYSSSPSTAHLEIYKEFGKTYYVKESSQPYKVRGQASWYGHAFHGRRTASGERFNMHAITAAHSTMPLPSYMRVTHLQNGKSIIVRVNDRMPRHKSRIIDLSYAAAKQLNMHRAGIASVEIERVYLQEK